jgi:hypothetical protein
MLFSYQKISVSVDYNITFKGKLLVHLTHKNLQYNLEVHVPMVTNPCQGSNSTKALKAIAVVHMFFAIESEGNLN